MKKIIVGSLFFGVSALTAVNFYGGQINLPPTQRFRAEKKLSSRQNQDIAKQVKKAFEAVRKNGGGQPHLEKLEKLGETVFPYLEPYLNDKNLSVRREVIYLALKIGGEKSFDLIALALRNPAPEIQKVASDQLYFYYSQYLKYLPFKKYAPPSMYTAYESFSPERIAANPQLGKALRDSLKAGNVRTATIYLLANFPNDETTSVLKELSVKSAPGSNSAAVASKIVLAELGNREMIGELLEYINKSDVRMLSFLLSSLNEIRSIEVLSALAKNLDNKSDITGGKGTKNPNRKLPGGGWAQGYPERRLCDFAVNSFVQRFALNNVNERPDRKISFPLHSTTYSDTQIAEVRTLIKERLAKLSAETK